MSGTVTTSEPATGSSDRPTTGTKTDFVPYGRAPDQLSFDCGNQAAKASTGPGRLDRRSSVGQSLSRIGDRRTGFMTPVARERITKAA